MTAKELSHKLLSHDGIDVSGIGMKDVEGPLLKNGKFGNNRLPGWKTGVATIIVIARANLRSVTNRMRTAV